MAIIKCPKCNHDVSDKAHKCPRCGLQIDGKSITTTLDLFEKNGKMVFRKKTVIILVVLLCITIILAFWITNAHTCSASGCHNTRVRNGEYCSRHTCTALNCRNYKSPDSAYCYMHEKGYEDYYEQTKEYATDVLIIGNVKVTNNSSYTICTGTITNTGKKTYRFIQIKGSFKNSSGSVVNTDSAYAVGSEGLAPGELE